MSDERLARQWCDLLGWMWRDVPVASPPVAQVWACGDRFKIGFRDGREYAVDLPTLATCTMVRHAGPVDVGPCPECEGRIDVRLAAHDFRADIIGSREQITPMAMERWRSGLREVVHEHTGMWRDVGISQSLEDSTRCEVTGLDDLMAPCSCDVDGKPMGRRTVSAPEAVLMAAPEWCETCAGSGEPGNGAWVDWLDESSYDEPARRASPTECPDCRGHGFTPGPEGAREALRALTEGWREHLPVLADWMAAHGELIFEVSDLERYSKRASSPSLGGFLEHDDEPPSSACKVVPRSLAECPAVARWVLAWLAGECPACGGRGANEYCERCSAPTDEVYGRVSSGRAIGPHLPAIYAHLTAAWERETVECGDCEGSGWSVGGFSSAGY